MGGWEGLEFGSEFDENMGWLLAEDLLARVADSEDPKLQQPLVEFNPRVRTLPEFGHYLDKQDRDGWSQLRNSMHSASALYAAQMLYFLRQESQHLGLGEQVIEEYLKAAVIPMDLHFKMEWEWSARAYRLHGNPLYSGGALKYWRLGIKNPIAPLDQPAFGQRTFRIPHKDEPSGYATISINPKMDKRHLNGFAVWYLRQVLRRNNQKRSKLLNEQQRREMRKFLEEVTTYVPDKERERILESGVMPTAALSWRPEHLAFIGKDDPWTCLKGYYTNVFGFPIPNEREYREYRTLVELVDREQILDLTSRPGWIAEEVDHDVYGKGPVQPLPGKDVVLFEFEMPYPVGRNRKIFTMPEIIAKLRSQERHAQPQQNGNGNSGWEFLKEIRDDVLPDGEKSS